MASPVTGIEDGKNSTTTRSEDEVSWPLTFRLMLPQQIQGQPQNKTDLDSNRPAKKIWWSHKLYRGPDNQPVQIQYSKSKEDSETLARQFLDEPVVGFDMEWPWNDRKKAGLQTKVGLIQVASIDKIALFHIGLHPGKTVDEIIAPSLRKLIESPSIGKLGVGVLSADFARLEQYFGLKPKAAVELSHLYRLTKFGGSNPEYVSTKLVSLADIVKAQLGYPLYKGDVRTSNWSKPLSRDQIDYAAGDAYAGFMLYHCMNYNRLKMDPVPPLPMHADLYLPSCWKRTGVTPLRLNAWDKDGTAITSDVFFGVKMTDRVRVNKSKAHDSKSEVVSGPKPPKIPKELSDPTSQALYHELVSRRSSIAEKAGVPVYRITTNPVLLSLALERPLNNDQLSTIKGIGKGQQGKYGHEWLEVISQHVNLNGTATITESTNGIQKVVPEPPGTLKRTPGRRRTQAQASPNSSLGFGSPNQRTAQLHTGLSFTMAETKLEAPCIVLDDDATSYGSNDSLPSLDFESPASKTPCLKRKRTESPSKQKAKSLSDPLQDAEEVCDDTSIPAAITPRATHTSFTLEPFTPRSKIARNKLLAFSKLVTKKIAQRPLDAPPIVSERTLSLLVVRAPRTLEELEQIPGIDSLLLACQQTDVDLLRNVVKFVAAGRN
ncbi:hypothetical protein GQ44DRAFT_698286 [Phaeosphaeriaceae sp. PMI808]|nr:hypothetical protein GQ44DRAFT_698286 [Phaeosphaeriaceae sp. PMI808]